MQLKIDFEQKSSVGELHFEHNVLTMFSGRFFHLITSTRYCLLLSFINNVFKFSVDFFKSIPNLISPGFLFYTLLTDAYVSFSRVTPIFDDCPLNGPFKIAFCPH